MGQAASSPELAKEQEMVSGYFKNERFSDVRIVVGNDGSGDTSFPAHRLVLCRSPVLRTMLEERWSQSSSVFGKASEIKISDFEKHVVEGLLEYMYKGKTHIIPALAEDFLRIADFYLLSGLIVDAEAVLSANITAVNAVHNYQVGETYRLPSLKLKVVEFVQKNKMDITDGTAGVKELAKYNLQALLELCKAVYGPLANT